MPPLPSPVDKKVSSRCRFLNGLLCSQRIHRVIDLSPSETVSAAETRGSMVMTPERADQRANFAVGEATNQIDERLLHLPIGCRKRIVRSNRSWHSVRLAACGKPCPTIWCRCVACLAIGVPSIGVVQLKQAAPCNVGLSTINEPVKLRCISPCYSALTTCRR